MNEANETEEANAAMGDCGHEGCGWRGPIDDLSYLGPLGPSAIGPLCPDCGDTVEPDEGMEALYKRLGWRQANPASQTL